VGVNFFCDYKKGLNMKAISFIKKNAIAMSIALAAVIGFSAFKMAEDTTGKPLAPVTIYFQGNPANASQVSNESLWTDEPNEEDCNNVNQLACSMIVDEDDLTPSGELDPAKIQLGASSTSSGFTPTRTGGNSQTQFNPTNRSQQ